MSDLRWQPSAARDVLQRRAEIVDSVRDFFRRRQVLEVDVPVLQSGANLDHGVVPMRVDNDHRRRFLPTSPEHPLKRLVAAGHGAVWTLAPAFRLGEQGQRHAPEFRMLEWYRPHWNDVRLRDEVIELLSDLTGLQSPVEVVTWHDAFMRHVHLDPFHADAAHIISTLGTSADAIAHRQPFDRAAALDLLLTERIEPHLGRQCWTILTDYPATACAQACLRVDAQGRHVAARFEVYRNGVELANGYWELTDSVELRRRHEQELLHRQHGELLDQRFHAAMAAGMPDCAGVAVGFDRVIMLALGLDSISAIQAFDWDRA